MLAYPALGALGSKQILHFTCPVEQKDSVKNLSSASMGQVRNSPRLSQGMENERSNAGNKFSGDESDSNILKYEIFSILTRPCRLYETIAKRRFRIFRMLARDGDNQYHYYQPGIGTYVTTGSLTHTSWTSRLESWYEKAKDSAIGTSFAEHVMGGYKVSSVVTRVT